MKFNPAGMMEALPKALIGWGGVFIVTIAIIGVVALLEKLTSGKKEK